MTKFIKTLLSIAGGCLVLGIILSIVGLCLGGRLTSIRVGWDNGPRVYYTDAFTDGEFGMFRADASGAPSAPGAPSPSSSGSVPTGSVRELEIDISTAEVVIQPGDAYDLQVSGSPRYESRVSGGVWTIKTTGDWQLRNWENVKFFITVPRDTVFDEVELSIGAGTLKADGLACRTADLEVGAGEMTVKNLTCTQESSLDVGMGKLTMNGGSLDGKNEVSCGMGVAEVAVSRPADYGYALESGMGSVTIDDYSHSGMGVELEVNRSAATFYDIECGMGEVTITFN